jgi:Protein of unknown function (DUF3021).
MRHTSEIIRLVNWIMTGFGLGAIATVIYLLIALRLQLPLLSTALMLKELLGSMAFGTYCTVLSFVFKRRENRWSAKHLLGFLFWRTTVHFLLLFCGFLMAGQWLGWFNLNDWAAVSPIASFLFVYIIVWIIFYFYNRSLARQLNNQLKKL